VDDDVEDGGAHCGAGIASESHDATLRSVAPTAPGHSTLMRESGSHGRGDLSTSDVWMAVSVSDVGTRAAENSARARPARRRVRIAGQRTTVGQAAAADGGRLRQLPKLLRAQAALHGCSDASQLVTTNTFQFDARLEWRKRPVAQLLRATHDLYRKPWWDYVLYQVPGASPSAKPLLGLARLLVRAVDGRRREFVIVQCLEDAVPRPECVLTRFKCQRKKWVIDPASGFPALAYVPLADVMRLEHVVPDFEDLAERWGMTATPTTVPESRRERMEQRYFTNAFFSWTTNSVTIAP